jgi:alkylation response protein AidB-like acyl-CoA dehydrogenase
MLAAPEAHDGMGAGLAEAAVLQQELGRGPAPIPFAPSYLAARALALWPVDGPAAALFPGLSSGETAAAFALESAALKAEKSGDGWRVSGGAALVADGAGADLFVVSVVNGKESGLALLKRRAGVETETLPMADLTRSGAKLICNAEIAADYVVFGAAAARLAATLLDEARILLANDSAAGAEAILEKTIEYLKTRVQFGKPIGTFQALKHRCADHKVRVEAAKFLVEKANGAPESERSLWASLAKFNACDAYADLAADCIQLHGGIGFTWEHDAHLYLKRAMLNQFLLGGSALEQDRAAHMLMEQAQ